MSYLALLLVLFLSACGGENRADDSHLIDVGNDGAGIPSENCTSEALLALQDVVLLCDNVLNEEDKELCALSTETYKKDYPNVICNLEEEVIVVEKFIEEEIVEVIIETDPIQELRESGFFDE